jgi:flagellar hook-basal body complex protein FliE
MADPIAAAAASIPVLRVTPGQATGAYLSTMSGTASAAAGPDFGAVLSQAVDSAIATSADAEHKATTALEGGDVSITDVVTSVERADATLQTTTALRDRMAQAWQTIMQMAI